MILYVWKYENNVYTKTAVIDYATSIIWVTRFNKAGEFELYLPASPQLLQLFDGEILLTRDDSETSMIPEKVVLTTSAENGDYLTISGRSSESIIGRRIVLSQWNFSGTAENCVRQLITENVVSPIMTERQINVVSLGESNGYTDAIQKQITGKNVLDSISDICNAFNYGFKMPFNGTQFVFNLYKGTDRSLDQSENTHVVFSPEFENLGNTQYSYDTTTFYTFVRIAGEGEGTNRTIIGVGYPVSTGLITGMNRREKWVDARNTSSNNGEITQGQYMAILLQQGNEELYASEVTTKFDGEILNVNGYVYGTDYNLGDKVSIVNEYGITGTATVTEITEVEDETGYRLIPTFSEWSV